MTRVSLVRAAEGSRLRLTPLGHPVDKPRIAAPGRGWDTILAMQTDENADTGVSCGEVPGSIPVAAALDFGVGDAPPSPTPHPPHVRLHRAMTPLDLAAAPPPFPGSLLGVDAIVEWLEILPPNAPAGRSPTVGACHVFNVAGALARDPARAKAFGLKALDPPGVGAPAGAAGAGGPTRPQPDWDVRWTLTGPAAVTLPDGSGESAEISVTLRAHNPSPEPVRLTFRSTCGDDDDGGDDGGWKRATLSGWGEPAAIRAGGRVAAAGRAAAAAFAASDPEVPDSDDAPGQGVDVDGRREEDRDRAIGGDRGRGVESGGVCQGRVRDEGLRALLDGGGGRGATATRKSRIRRRRATPRSSSR